MPSLINQALLPAVLALAVLSSGCSEPDRLQATPKVPAGGVLVSGAGATLPAPLYKKWFETYGVAHPATVVTYDAVGSGEGIRRFLRHRVKDEESVDFGASDAAMRDEEIAQISKGVVLVPMTADAVVLAYNLPNFQGDLRLSRKAYAGIFLGEIRNWNDPLIARANRSAKLPKLTLTTVVRQDGSGTTYAFTKHLDAISEKWRSEYGPATLVNWPGDAMRARGNEGVAARIKQSEGSIGYVSSQFAKKLGLRVAILENKAGEFVQPTEQNCRASLASAELPENLRAFLPDPAGRDDYPIVTFSWVLLYKDYADAGKARAVRDLMRWCLSQGQQQAAMLGYIGLPTAVTAKALAAVDMVGPTQ